MIIGGNLELWHATVLELIWTLMGAFGFWIGWTNLQYSKRDLKALEYLNGQDIPNRRIIRIIAFGHYRNDLFRLSKHSTVLAIGVISCILPSPNSNIVKVTPSGIVVTGGLFTIVLLLIMSSALDRRQREGLEEMSHDD